MSKFTIKTPVTHIPKVKEYQISGVELYSKLGYTVPFGMLDSWYYYADMEGWGSIIQDMVFKSSLYSADKFDCDNYALKAMSVCAERYGLNAFGVAIGASPAGRHAFNIFYNGERFMLWEANDGFSFSGHAFEIGENGYIPELILL